MEKIERLMSLLHWSRGAGEQAHGRTLARDMTDLRIFLQPDAYGGKAVWDNCALILAERSDAELAPYLEELLAWLQDINWPGTLTILSRLRRFSGKALPYAVTRAAVRAELMGECGESWLGALAALLENHSLTEELPAETLRSLRAHSWDGV